MMKTIWTAGGDAINMRDPSEAPVSVVIEFQKLEAEGKEVEATLLLAEAMVEFKEDMEIIRKMSMPEFTEFVADWISNE